MGILGTGDQDVWGSVGGMGQGPYWLNTGAVFAIVPDETNDKVRAWRSLDSGYSWEELDSANAPAATISNHRMGVGVDRLSDTLHVLIPHDTEAGAGATRTDIEWQYYTFDMAARTWSAKLSTAPFNSSNRGGNDNYDMPFAFRVRSDGDLVLAYGIAGDHSTTWDRTFFATYNGTSWTSGISAGEGTATIGGGATVDNTVNPISMARGASDRMHLVMYSPDNSGSGSDSATDDRIHTVSLLSNDSVGTFDPNLLHLYADAGGIGDVGDYPVGLGAYDSGSSEVIFPVLVTASSSPFVSSGVKILRATSVDDPSWTIEAVMEDADFQADTSLAVGVDPTVALYVDGQRWVLFQTSSGFAYSTHASGAWTDPLHLPTAAIPNPRPGVATSWGAGIGVGASQPADGNDAGGQGVTLMGPATTNTGAPNNFTFAANFILPGNAEEAAAPVIGVAY